jgi:hypothetical protein
MATRPLPVYESCWRKKDKTIGESLPSAKTALFHHLTRNPVMLSFFCNVSCAFQLGRPAMDGRWRLKCCEAGNDDCSSSARITSPRWKTTRGFFSVDFGDLWRKDKRNQRAQAVVKRWRMGYLVWARQV